MKEEGIDLIEHLPAIEGKREKKQHGKKKER